MPEKNMSCDESFVGVGTYRGKLEVIDGLVVRFVFAGTPTYYIYGVASDQPKGIDGQSVQDVTDEVRRQQLRRQLAARLELSEDDVVWATLT
ncbi:MAG: hypothetical protein V1738_03260 [Patescibacteria group bacterium]